ncbi:MAG: hypothetical protein WCJ64_08070 [Rhodospirillaceae bacterium]
MPLMIFRQGTVVTVVSDKGIVQRSFDAFSVPRAVALEAKLRGDALFAAEWTQQVEPNAPPSRAV